MQAKKVSIIIILMILQTYTQVRDVDYLRTDCIDGRTAADLADPDGTSDGSHTRAVGLPCARSPQGTPAADGVTRGQTLGAGGEGVAHVNGVTEKLEREGERERERERERKEERERGHWHISLSNWNILQ